VDPKLPAARKNLLSSSSSRSGWRKDFPPPNELSDSNVIGRQPTTSLVKTSPGISALANVSANVVPEAQRWKIGLSSYKAPPKVNEDPDWEAYSEEEKKQKLRDQLAAREEARRLVEVALMTKAEYETSGLMNEISDNETLPPDMLKWLDLKLKKHRYVALVYFAGTWDAWSRDYLYAVQRDVVPHFKKYGGRVYGITAQKGGLAELRAELGLTFRLVTDQSLLLAQKYRVQKCPSSESPYVAKHPTEYPNGFHQCGMLVRDRKEVLYHWFLAQRKIDKDQTKYFEKKQWPIYPDFVATIWYVPPLLPALLPFTHMDGSFL
jgi:peroxiredoxin